MGTVVALSTVIVLPSERPRTGLTLSSPQYFAELKFSIIILLTGRSTK